MQKFLSGGSRLFILLYQFETQPGENLNSDFEKACKEFAQASAALVLDLKGRGILTETS